MKNIGHNKPPENFTDQEEKTDLEKLINDAGRVKLTNTIIKKYLNRKYNPENDKYIPVSVNDSEKIGMKARINAGGAISFYYSYTPKGKQKNGKRFNPVYYTLGNFPEMWVDAARRLTEDLKHAIKLGKDPKSILEERKAAKTLNEVIALWKEKILYKTNPPSKADIEQRLKNWIDLEAYDPGLIKVILNNKKDLSIGSRKMVDLTKTDLIAWHAAISKRGKYQANRCVDDLSTIFSWALEQDIIKKDICKFRDTELNEETDRLEDVDPYSHEEWRQLRMAALKLVKQQPRVFLATMGILLAMYTGRRYKSEILNLKWSQVDWDVNKIRLPETKTGKSQYSINRITRWVLRNLLKYNKEKFKGKKSKSIKAAYLFPSSRGKTPYMQDVRKTYLKICAAANVRSETPYLFRHTWGCLALIATNGNMKAVKDECGWKTFKMLERYARFNERQLQKHSEVIGSFLARKRA